MMQELHNLNIEGKPDICVFAKEIYSEKQFLKMLSSGEKFAIGAGENGAKRIDLLVWDFNKDTIEFYNAMGMDIQSFVFEKKI